MSDCCNLNFLGRFCTEDGTTVIGYVKMVEGRPEYSFFNVTDGLPYLGVVYTDVCSTLPLFGSAVLDFPNTLAQSESDLTIAVVGAAVGDVVSLGVDIASVPTGGNCFTAFVSATDVVTVRFNNYGAVAKNPASGTFNVIVYKS